MSIAQFTQGKQKKEIGKRLKGTKEEATRLKRKKKKRKENEKKEKRQIIILKKKKKEIKKKYERERERESLGDYDVSTMEKNPPR